MRTAWLLPLALVGCSAPDPAVFGDGPTLAVGSASATSAASTSSSSATGGAGGAGGQGGASTSTGAGGAGGMGGQGGGLGGGGGGEPCEPDPNPCEGMPGGQCGEWVDSCGTPIVCGNEACTPGILACWIDLQACVCQTLAGYQLAVNTCNALGLGAPFECSDVGPLPDIPPTCVDTGVVNSDGHIIWCCD